MEGKEEKGGGNKKAPRANLEGFIPNNQTLR